jgi:type IV pilus secretin PilQ/predicted competence protein
MVSLKEGSMNIQKSDLKVKILSMLVAVVFASSMLCTEGLCQMEAATTAPAATEAEPAESVVTPPLPKPGNVTVNFKDVDIKTVLHYLSEVSGVDIVPSPGVEGNVTMRLRDKPWEVALDIVTRNYGFAYSREKDIIRVMPKGRLQTEEPITEVIPLNYVIQDTEGTEQNVSQLIEAIKSVIVEKAGEKATFLPSANAIVVTAIPARVGTIKTMVAQIDKKTPQIMLEAKVIEVTLDRNDQFGVDWNTVITASGAKRPTTLPFMNNGLLRGINGEWQRRFYPTSNLEGQDEIWNFPHYTEGVGTSGLVSPIAAPTAGATFLYGTLDFSQFEAVIRLIDERDDTNILSSPRITTLNNQTATIKVVQNVYLQKESKASDTANTVTVEFETTPREVGVILEVTPHVNDKGEIAVSLKPEVSSNLTFSELEVSGADNTVAMTYNTRQAETQIMVSDGQTIFIGGLITETTTKQEHKFPILGDLFGGIPGVGGIFKYEQDNIDKTEVVFFVTVHLVKDPRDSIIDSNSMEQYNKHYPETPIVKAGPVKVTEHKVTVPSTTGPVEEVRKARKPFLDFRKKKK